MDVARLIGNAVPVRMGEVVGRSIVAHPGRHGGGPAAATASGPGTIPA